MKKPGSVRSIPLFMISVIKSTTSMKPRYCSSNKHDTRNASKASVHVGRRMARDGRRGEDARRRTDAGMGQNLFLKWPGWALVIEKIYCTSGTEKWEREIGRPETGRQQGPRGQATAN